MRAVAAAKARETARHGATGQELAQLALDKARNPLTAAALARLGEKGLEVLADHSVQQTLLRLAPHVRLTPATEFPRVPVRTGHW